MSIHTSVKSGVMFTGSSGVGGPNAAHICCYYVLDRLQTGWLLHRHHCYYLLVCSKPLGKRRPGCHKPLSSWLIHNKWIRENAVSLIFTPLRDLLFLQISKTITLLYCECHQKQNTPTAILCLLMLKTQIYRHYSKGLFVWHVLCRLIVEAVGLIRETDRRIKSLWFVYQAFSGPKHKCSTCEAFPGRISWWYQI